jgi:trk system potassium uptake protein TrkH
VLGHVMLILAACLLAPLVVALIYRSGPASERQDIISFAVTIAVALGIGLVLQLRFKGHVSDVSRREGFLIVTGSWLTAVGVGMLPFLLSGATDSVTDAFFETMSGFTTTGATIFSGPEIEKIPHGLGFWRCMTQWLGGMGIVVLGVAILSFLGVGGYRLLKAETPGGVAYERERPRITDAAKELWMLYVGISMAEVIALKLAGASVYDAFCHTFTTMSTGGFSPHGDSVAFFGPAVQWIIIFFMFIAGMNFSLHAQLLRGQGKALLLNSEFWVYTALIVLGALVGVIVLPSDSGLEKLVRDALFQVISIGTTTGYATADFDKWPEIMRLILLLLMFTGGCMGSTGGGVKAARLIIYAKTLVRELHLLIYPRVIHPIRMGNKVVEPEVVANILAFGALYSFTFLVGALVMAAFGYDLVTAMSTSAAALGNVGPGLGGVGPMENWSHLPAAAKWVMSALMLLGRLELFSTVVLLTPYSWKR